MEALEKSKLATNVAVDFDTAGKSPQNSSLCFAVPQLMTFFYSWPYDLSWYNGVGIRIALSTTPQIWPPLKTKI